MFFSCLILNTLSGFLIASIFRNILIFFISFFAFCVLNMEILSLFRAIDDKNILIFSILNLIFSIVFFKYKKVEFLKPNFDFKRLKNSFLLDKSLIILSISFLILILITFLLAFLSVPLEPDSQTYHFLRAFEFVKNHNLNHFETNDIRALVMPINSEILYAWMLALKKNFVGFGLVSFFSYIFVIFSIFSLSDELKLPYRKRLWVVFMLSSLSSLIISIPSLQTDILVGALLLAGFILFIKNSLFFASLALALSFGTKSSAIMAFLGFITLCICFEYFKNKKIDIKKFFKFFSFLALNFIIFSSYNYIQNIIQFHNPLSNEPAYIGHRFWGGIEGYISNLVHYFFQFFDFTGFKWGYYLNNKIMSAQESVFEVLKINPLIGCNINQDIVNITTDEQMAGFGILGFLVFLPAIVHSFFTFKKNKKSFLYFSFALCFLVNILVLAFSVAWMVFSIRFILSFIILSSLIFAKTYFKKGKKEIFKYIIIFFSLFYMTLIPFCIKRMPFRWVLKSFIESNFNFEKYTNSAFRGSFINTAKSAPIIYDTILERYKDKKKIAIIKTTSSLFLYLTLLEYKGYRIDFLTLANIDLKRLKNYDLIIAQGKVQDDDVFNSKDEKINYEIINNNVIFKTNDNEALDCFYYDMSAEVATDMKNVFKRQCFTHSYLNKTYKLNSIEKIETDELEKFDEIYYFKPN